MKVYKVLISYEGKLDNKELSEFYKMPLDRLLEEAKMYTSDRFEFCSLISAKTGICSQDCKYCSQSVKYNTKIDSHALVDIACVKKAALEAKKNKATRFAIVTSGKSPEENDMDKMLEMIKEINKIEGLTSCASLGILKEEQIKKLKTAGLNRYHHNINTCESYHHSVCTTHSYQDRIKTVNLVKKYGMELCCGVIIGMGESVQQRIEMALELGKINPDSIPVNVLTPIKGTPFESYIDKIDEEEILRTLAIFKIASPKSVIRLAGGRNSRISEKAQKTAVLNCVEGLLIGNYLTTLGIEPEEDIEMVTGLEKIL